MAVVLLLLVLLRHDVVLVELQLTDLLLQLHLHVLVLHRRVLLLMRVVLLGFQLVQPPARHAPSSSIGWADTW